MPLLGSVALLGSAAGEPRVRAVAPKYGVGRTPTPEEIRAMDISISPTGEELPAGHGTAKEGAKLFEQGVHRLPWRSGPGRAGARVAIEKGPRCSRLGTGAHPAAERAVCDDRVGLHQSRHASRGGGDLTADEVYALTAYLLFLNKVIPEDQVLDKESLPKVKMPIGDDYGRLPEWKHGTPRLKGYPY